MTHAAFRDVLGWWSWCRYVAWRLTGQKSVLRCRLATGERLIVRPPPSSDLHTANEVFASAVYRLPKTPPQPFHRVIDLGSNVGYTLLYWARLFPEAQITGFEPHPRHQGLIREHLRLNRLEDRVDLVEAAAGVAAGMANLSDDESGSTLFLPTTATRVPVTVVDVFDTLLAGEIDLLKIDIEGSEYPILADPRFATVQAGLVIIEWHRRQDSISGPDWCEARLREAGYDVVRGWEFTDFGILWGVRPGKLGK